MSMSTSPRDSAFGGEIARLYERHLVPLIFAPYAEITASRIAALEPARVLEIACGTGVLTRALAIRLPKVVSITATDLNPSMLDEARRIGARRPVDWQQADALALPFPADSADVVVCQFGAMFFPEKAKAFAEACRVLAPGGAFVFSVWDRIEENEVADVVTNAMKSVFPEDPPWFMRRTPHGYFDRATIERDLSLGGFQGAIELETIAARSRATSASDVAVAICQGTPLRNEIEARDPTRLAVATEAATRALVERFGDGAIDAKMQAHVFVVRR